MTDPFAVRYTDAARDDLLRLLDFLLDRARTAEDFDAAQDTVDAIHTAVETHLARTPFIFRKAGASPFLRELVIPLRRTGYVAMYEIEAGNTVTILAIRHQREDDYH
nr:type II toxin-antitoxin system RelE/ParE family toxin [uncultured Albidiferax sp.]